MELRTINTFLHIAELHSFPARHGSWGIPSRRSPAQVAQLEAELETPLFDQVGKTVRLTDAGQTFLTYARSRWPLPSRPKGPCSLPGRSAVPCGWHWLDSVCQHFSARPAAAVSRPLPAGGLVLRTATDDGCSDAGLQSD